MSEIDYETVYAVSSGSYSDYSVLCVCPSREDAEAVAEKVASDPDTWHGDARVEEMLVMDADSVMKHELLRMETVIWDDGSEDKKDTRLSVDWPWSWGFEPAVAWRWVRAPCHNGRGGRLEVWGCDHERVRKVFSDKRAQLLSTPAAREKKEDKGRYA